MNFSLHDSILLRQRCRQWTPLVTQQLRLRHLYQVLAYNITVSKRGSLYYTLHLTSMSAPFYTSEKLGSVNPKWAELEFLNISSLSTTAFVVRIWQKMEHNNDVIIITWGINLSGLIHLGNRLIDIQPECFNNNSVILQLRGGFFSSKNAIKTGLAKPLLFSENLGMQISKDGSKVLRSVASKYPLHEIKSSYNVDKLRKLHSIQISIKNCSLDAQQLRDKISSKCALCDTGPRELAPAQVDPTPPSSVRYAPQLLTMNCLNKMLQDKPTKVQMHEIVRIRKEIELFKFKTKMLSQERDRKSAQIRMLKMTYTVLSDKNDEIDSQLMENYRKLSKGMEKLKVWKKEQIQQREELLHISSQLYHRRRHLVAQLLVVYPIREVHPNKYFVNNVYLPDADLLADISDSGLSVALGYVAHILTMCASFLQVPLRYPVFHMGSRSHIIDNVAPNLLEREREFPLYTKGKDRMQFNYAVFLLNKNIAQLRCLYGLNTPELKSTLRNLLSFLQGKEEHRENACKPQEQLGEMSSKKAESVDNLHKNTSKTASHSSLTNFESTANISDPILDALKQESQLEKTFSPTHKTVKRKPKQSESGPGLSEILAIPEAFLNKQITSSAFRNYCHSNVHKMEAKSADDPLGDLGLKTANSSANSSHSNLVTKYSDVSCDTNKSRAEEHLEPVEQGTDMLSTHQMPNDLYDKLRKLQNRKSRSVGSYTDDDALSEYTNNFEVGSDPLINVSSDTRASASSSQLPDSPTVPNHEFLEKWLDSGPALVCSEQNLYPDEFLGTDVEGRLPERLLTLRTDALLNTTSFNLVKPKF